MENQNTFEKIYDIVRQIPRGTVASYGQIAELAGNRRWSRVVGYALHAVPIESDIPCHRRTSRAFGGTDGSLQKELLEAEGVEFIDGMWI